jgi:hypothetical protein
MRVCGLSVPKRARQSNISQFGNSVSTAIVISASHPADTVRAARSSAPASSRSVRARR